jgi:DNA-directed RNA polymerase specialized sigma subunit
MIDITAAVSELDQAAQAIVRLWIIEGLDVRIVSERLRISESTLYRRRLEILQALDQHPAFDTSWS